MNELLLRALEYVRNTGETATVAAFDDDHEPVGPLLRADLVPTYIEIRAGVLKLTIQGREAIDRVSD
jgi:hypothetical protein